MTTRRSSARAASSESRSKGPARLVFGISGSRNYESKCDKTAVCAGETAGATLEGGAAIQPAQFLPPPARDCTELHHSFGLGLVDGRKGLAADQLAERRKGLHAFQHQGYEVALESEAR